MIGHLFRADDYGAVGKNHCYRNAMIQCLLHVPEVIDFLKNTHNECNKPTDDTATNNEPAPCIACDLRSLAQAYWETPGADTALIETRRDALYASLRKTFPRHDEVAYNDVQNDRQLDSHDFLSHLHDQLEKAEPANPDPTFNLRTMFEMRYNVQWICKDCNTLVSRAASNSLGLSVSLQIPRKGLDLVEYLRHETFTDTLQIRCESTHCLEKHGAMVDGQQRQRRNIITHAPEVLIVRLLRFEVDPGTLVEQKITDPVRFEEYLNLAAYNTDNQPLMYRLRGVVAHSGTMDFGHYIAGVALPDDQTFRTVNDNRVEQVRRGTVRELEVPPKGFEPYVLVYSKM